MNKIIRVNKSRTCLAALTIKTERIEKINACKQKILLLIPVALHPIQYALISSRNITCKAPLFIKIESTPRKGEIQHMVVDFQCCVFAGSTYLSVFTLWETKTSARERRTLSRYGKALLFFSTSVDKSADKSLTH